MLVVVGFLVVFTMYSKMAIALVPLLLDLDRVNVQFSITITKFENVVVSWINSGWLCVGVTCSSEKYCHNRNAENHGKFSITSDQVLSITAL